MDFAFKRLMASWREGARGPGAGLGQRTGACSEGGKTSSLRPPYQVGPGRLESKYHVLRFILCLLLNLAFNII